jgi:hypothetical protein
MTSKLYKNTIGYYFIIKLSKKKKFILLFNINLNIKTIWNRNLKWLITPLQNTEITHVKLFTQE